MLVIIKRPFEKPERTKISGSLESLQNAVGGHIEHLGLGCIAEGCSGRAGILFDEDGKAKRKDPNFFFINDVIVGTVVFVGETEEDFTDLSEEQARFIEEMFGVM